MNSPLFALEYCKQFSAQAAHYLWDVAFHLHGVILESHLSQEEQDELEAPAWWGKERRGKVPYLDPNTSF